jgi:ABC-type uncharacterized transport system permease subunit
MYIQDVLLKLKAASDGAFARPKPLLWFIAAAMVGPFMLLTIGGRESNNLPWYVWTMMPVLLLTVISVGFLRFTRQSRAAECVSISPDRR